MQIEPYKLVLIALVFILLIPIQKEMKKGEQTKKLKVLIGALIVVFLIALCITMYPKIFF